jgi:hypothetical protein
MDRRGDETLERSRNDRWKLERGGGYEESIRRDELTRGYCREGSRKDGWAGRDTVEREQERWVGREGYCREGAGKMGRRGGIL